MGVSDRRYMTDEDQTFGVGGGRRVSALGLLIIINAGVWIVWQVALHSDSSQLPVFMQKNFLCSLPEVVENYRVHTLFTRAISHQDLMHLVFNMFGLYLFGSEVEHIYGSKNFIFAYFFCGLIGGFAHLLFSMFGQPHASLGASAAVMGLGAIAAIYNPSRPINLYGIFTVSLKWLVIGYIVLDTFGLMQGGTQIGHAAHLGGALGGLLFWKLDLRLFASRGRRNSGAFQRIRGWFSKKKLSTVRKAGEREYADTEPEVGATASRRVSPMHMNASNARPISRGPSVDAETARRVDDLLAKISRDGMNSLTDEERNFLKASSEKYKKR